MLTVICEICGERIGKTDLSRLAYPLRGNMFDSIDPDHGFPPPFDAGLDWEYFRCFYGRTHRPFILDNQVLTDQGMVTVSRGNAGNPEISENVPRRQRQDTGDMLATIPDEIAEGLAHANLSIAELGQAPVTDEPEISDEDAEALVRAAMAKGEPPVINGAPNLAFMPVKET